MPGYIGLLKYTQQGLADIKNGCGRYPKRSSHRSWLGCLSVGSRS